MKIQVEKLYTIIYPEEGMRIKDLNTGDVFEANVYLSKIDTPDHYCEIPLEEAEVIWAEEERTD